jgi:hypothetical protein
MERTVKYAVMIGFGVALTAAATSPSSAQTASPWCLRVVASDYSVDLCEYRSFEACNQQRINEGNRSYCLRNPALLFPESGDKKDRTRRVQ